jgi:hypothetical protein
MTTANTLTGDALGLLGVSDPTDAVAPEDATLGLRALNRIVDALGVDSLMPIAIAYQAVSLTAAGASLTFGTGGDVAVDRPTRIEMGAYVRSGGIDYTMEKFNRDRWAAISDKSQTGIPCFYFYEQVTAALGRLNFWPVPDAEYTAYIPLQSRLSAFADLTTEYSLPAGYDEYLTAALAAHMAPFYNREAPQSVVARMRIARRLIKRLNVQIPRLGTPELNSLSARHSNSTSVQSLIGDEIDIY